MADPIPVGKIPSGLFIITVTDGESKEGFLASWIQQVSFDPLMISIAIEPERPVLERIREVGCFCVNIVGHQNNGLLKPFWGGAKEGVNPLDAVETVVTLRGNVLLSDSMAALECELRETLPAGDHVIVLGEVVETRLLKPEDKPMTHVRKTGASY